MHSQELEMIITKISINQIILKIIFQKIIKAKTNIINLSKFNKKRFIYKLKEELGKSKVHS
jgi:hypothetical protein